jgi:alpha-1,3-rhamnosyltransferase
MIVELKSKQNQRNNMSFAIVNYKISVIIPYYNHINYIDECLKSIRGQDFENIEIIIVNDCSSDGSFEYLEKIKSKYNFKLVQNLDNVGCSASIEIGFEHTTGDYICILASDDLLVKHRFPGQLEKLVELKCDVLYGNCHIQNGMEKIYLTPRLNEFSKAYVTSNEKVLNIVLTQDFSLPLIQSAIFKRSVFAELQKIRKNYKSDDWVILINSFLSYKTGFVNIPMFIYRLHQNNSHSNYWNLLSNRFEVIADFTPSYLKEKAFSNILYSLSDYKYSNKEFLSSFKYGLASLIINFNFYNFKLIVFKYIKSIF